MTTTANREAAKSVVTDLLTRFRRANLAQDFLVEAIVSNLEARNLIATDRRPVVPDLGNTIAIDGITRCHCGCKYWEQDLCIDCGLSADDDLVKGDD